MAIAALVFVVIVALITGAYWLLVVRPEQRAQQVLHRRVTAGVARAQRRSRLLKDAKQAADIPILDAVLSRAGRLVRPLEENLEQSGLNLSPSGFVLLTALCAVCAWVLVSLLTGFSLLAIPAALVAAFIPAVVVRRKRTRRIRTFEEQFPEAIELIARALRAGHAFPTGLQMVAEEMGAPVGPEFQVLYDQQNYGLSLPEAMRAFAARIPLLDARFFVTAVLTQRETGGNLSEVLDNLAAVIRERFKVRRQVRVISAHGRITGWILTLLPPALALVLMFTVPGHIEKLFTNPMGHWLIATGIGLELLGALIIRRIVRVEY